MSDNTIIIDSQIQFGNQLNPFTENELRYEPMMFQGSFSFAYLNGGLATIDFLKNLPLEWHDDKTIIDSRVHMLMKGWYPCIPGYHHDDVPRERADGQPEYFNPSYRSEHAMAIYNGSICPTEFAIGKDFFQDIPIGEVYYKKWHPIVMSEIQVGNLKKVIAPENQIIFFNDRTWHQGTAAIKSGWRFFIRATRNTGIKPKK